MGTVITNRKCFLFLMTAAITTFMVLLTTRPDRYKQLKTAWERKTIVLAPGGESNKYDNFWRGLTKNETDKLSVVGRILFLGEEAPKIEKTDKEYEILVWKYGKTIENRHLKQFGTQHVDPFGNCSVKNCWITYKDEALKTADVVIFHLHRMTSSDVPKRLSQFQIWAFLTDESPYHTFLDNNKLTNYNGMFNWSMTYRMDSDIPVPYGRTVLNRQSDDVQNLTVTKRRDVLVAIMGSNCGGRNNRWKYVEELQKYITVDTYGACGTLKTCPGHFRNDCHDIDSYLFYLAFENSNCDEYVTEKLWWNAYEKNAIPIVMGASQDSYRKLLPPNSYLNIDDYAHPKDLANHLIYLNSTEKFRDFYEWKRHFKILNEHGYFQSPSYHYCRVCEALNYNSRGKKVYKDLSQFWSVSRDCHSAWNA